MDSRIREALKRGLNKSIYKERLDAMEPVTVNRWWRMWALDLEANVNEAFALLDAPVASDARELARKVQGTNHDSAECRMVSTLEAEILIESFVADRERKAREETALICAETYCNICKRQNRTMSCGPNLKCTIYHAIKEALNDK